MRDARRETFNSVLASAVLAAGLLAALIFLPLAPCPIQPNQTYVIELNVWVPGTPINAVLIECPCVTGNGRVSLLKRWRYRRAAGIVQNGG